MSIHDNLNHMLLTAVRRGVQLGALLVLMWFLPWPLLVAIALTHLGTLSRWLDADYRRTYEGY